MTAQINDKLIYEGADYALAGVSGAGLFDPMQHGLAPRSLSTACWRGFVCTYTVEGAALYLSELTIGLGQAAAAPGDPAPRIFGTLPSGSGFAGGLVYQLHEPARFSGGLLLGRDFIANLYVHMGFHPAWKYQTVVELLFEDGQLQRACDRSAAMAEYRESQGREPLRSGAAASRAEIEQWIARSFDRNYGD